MVTHTKEYMQAWRDANRQHYNDYFKRYRETYPKERVNKRQKKYREQDETRRKSLLYSAKERANRRGLEFTITIDDIIIPDVCPVLGIPLVVGTRGRNANSPSLDRINNDKGYIKGNVKVISWRANTLKSNATLEELERIVEYIRNEFRTE